MPLRNSGRAHPSGVQRQAIINRPTVPGNQFARLMDEQPGWQRKWGISTEAKPVTSRLRLGERFRMNGITGCGDRLRRVTVPRYAGRAVGAWADPSSPGNRLGHAAPRFVPPLFSRVLS